MEALDAVRAEEPAKRVGLHLVTDDGES